jgi:hypothetical protein
MTSPPPTTGTAASWAGPALLVPVAVDALVLTQSSYALGWSWIAPDYGFVQFFLPASGGLFQDSLPLPIDPSGNTGQLTGVMVRWALPDALTAGGTADQQTGALSFPAVPNRWLVLRNVPGPPGLAAAWMLASDYLGGYGSSFYADGAATTLGMCWPLADWPGEAALPAGLDPPLTALGLGDPTFAAYLPNVQHIFAFHDPLTGVNPGTVSYTVCGWYAGQAVDPLSGPASTPPGWQTAEEWSTVMSQLGWSVGDDLPAATAAAQAWAASHGYQTDPASPGTILPSRTICHGLVCDVTWPGTAGAVQTGVPAPNPSDPSTMPGLALAHSAADALAATVAAGAGAQETEVAEALTALLGDLLPLLGEPDGAGQLALRLQSTWFQQLPGGTSWQLAQNPQPDNPSGEVTPPLTAGQAGLLDALNAAQQQVDAAAWQVASLQWDIYSLWWKLSFVTANPNQPPIDSQAITTALQLKQSQATQAISGWQSAVAQCAAAQQAMTAQLGTLLLQQVPEPPFWRPNDPVVLVQGVGRSFAHGEDGRFTDDGSLYCRFTGQTPSALLVTGTTAAGTAAGATATVTAATLSLDPIAVPDGPPEIPDLATEAFFLDPGNAQAIVKAADLASPPQPAEVALQQTLVWNSLSDPTLDQQTIAETAGLQSEYGPVAVPSKVGVGYWTPPWAPLYLDWAATYYPTIPPAPGWAFPPAAPGTPLQAQTAQWTGTAPTAGVQVQGRALLTPQAGDALAARLEQLVEQYGDSADLQPYLTDINDAVSYLGSASVLSQALSGFNDLLLQRDPTLFQQPDLSVLGTWLDPPGGPAYTPTAAPSPESAVVAFSPIRAGFLQLNQLWVVDDFGQRYDVLATMQAYPPPGGQQVGPDLAPAQGAGLVQLKPRLIQPSRLLPRFLDALDDTEVVGLSSAANPICGWLIPNRPDNSIMVYDAAGVLQGDLLLAQTQAFWLPAPDLAPPAAQTAPPALQNPHLQALVTGVLAAANPGAALADLIATIEDASWAIAPSGPDAAQLATLIGFPVAVARVQLLLELAGNPATSQVWSETGLDDDGGASQASFQVELGSANLDDDGLVGYFLDSDPGQLSSPYGPSASGYVTFSPVSVTIGQPTALTLLLHPQGLVHAFTGILPPTSAALPPTFQLAPMHATEVTFRSGPLLSPPTALTAPLPAFGQGDWAWLQYDPSGAAAQPRPLSRANASAQLPGVPPSLRDGWLRLTLAVQPTLLTYSVTPPAVPTGATGLPGGTILTVTAYNGTSTPATCGSITVTVPTGDDPVALTASPELIQPVSAQPDTWTFEAAGAGEPGIFVATPVTVGAAVDPGATLTFTLVSIAVSASPGLVLVEIAESAGNALTTITLPVEKFSPPPALATPGAHPPYPITRSEALP